jgi:hypothetical protein
MRLPLLTQLLVAAIQCAVLFIVMTIHAVAFAVDIVAFAVQGIAPMVSFFRNPLMVMALCTLPAVDRTVLFIQLTHHPIKLAVHLLALAIEIIPLILERTPLLLNPIAFRLRDHWRTQHDQESSY